MIPVSRDANGLNVGSLGPFLDASGDEFWFGFAPDAGSEFGLDDGLEVRIDGDWTPPGNDDEMSALRGGGGIGTYMGRAPKRC